MEALFSVSYAAEFVVSNKLEQCDYAVMALEGKWWQAAYRKVDVAVDHLHAGRDNSQRHPIN